MTLDSEEEDLTQISEPSLRIVGESFAHPFDFKALQKDSTILQSEIEKVLGFKFMSNPQDYNFRLLGLVQQIRNERSDLAPNTRSYNLGIRIMTDSETLDWRRKLIDRSCKSIGREGRRVAAISSKGLTECEIKRRDHLAMFAQGTHKALMKARQEMERKLRLLEPPESSEEE